MTVFNDKSHTYRFGLGVRGLVEGTEDVRFDDFEEIWVWKALPTEPSHRGSGLSNG